MGAPGGGPVRLGTDRLVLRELEASDFTAVHGYATDPDIVRYMSWGSGYATEAALAVLGFAFTNLGVERIEAECDAANVRSIRVLEKPGMALEARLQEKARRGGNMRDRA